MRKLVVSALRVVFMLCAMNFVSKKIFGGLSDDRKELRDPDNETAAKKLVMWSLVGVFLIVMFPIMAIGLLISVIKVIVSVVKSRK